jgi:class 3 adenylate cyclase
VADDTRLDEVRSGRGADLRTFLIADIRGYTRYTRDHGDEAASAVAARFAEIVRGTVPGFEGELLELRGDEALCVFSSARQALRAGVALQRRLRTPVEGLTVLPLGVGIGLDAGEAVPTEGGYRGSALNLAARLCGQADGGEILATERLVGLAGPVTGLHWGRPRAIRLKGVRDPERVVRVESDEPLPRPPALPPERKAGRSRRTLLSAVAAGIVLVCVAVLVASQRGGGSQAAKSVQVRAQSVGVIDPRQDRVVADVALPAPPESIVAGSGHVWVGGTNQTVTPVRLTRPKAGLPIGLGIDPAELAYGNGAVWAFDANSRLAQVDAQHDVEIGQPHRLWRCVVEAGLGTKGTQCAAQGMVFVGNEIWVGNDSGLRVNHGVLTRIDTTTTQVKIVGRIPVAYIGLLAAGEGQVWLWGNVGRTVYLISRRGVVQNTDLGVPASYTGGGIAVGFGYAWVAAPSAGKLFGIASGQTTPTYQYRVPRGVSCIAIGGGSIWLGTVDGRILQVNPFSGHRQTYRIGHAPVAIAYSARRVWVALT